MSKYVELAKRLNNNKRGFLIVNPYLGKHVAQVPSEILNMFKEVSALGPDDMVAYNTLVIGFAETATALSTEYAIRNGTYFLQTTRENIGNVEKIYFSEEHSHATAQYIIASELDYISNHIDRIVFIDDEITTGKTIKNAIAAIEAHSDGEHYKYEMVSVLNSMTEETIKEFENDGIGVYYLEHLDVAEFEEFAANVSSDDEGAVIEKAQPRYVPKHEIHYPKWSIADTRINVVDGFNHERQVEKLADEIANVVEVNDNEKTLVLGIEEFMYLPLKAACALEQKGIDVRFHATTRSPIVVKETADYPFSERYDLHGCYEFNRETYLYNVDNYDNIIIIAENKYIDNNGLKSLISAIDNKTKRIQVVII